MEFLPRLESEPLKISHDILEIKSRDRTSGTASSFILTSARNYRGVRALKLISTSISACRYNVKNASVRYTDSVNNITFTVPNGNYTDASLILALNNSMVGYAAFTLSGLTRFVTVQMGLITPVLHFEEPLALPLARILGFNPVVVAGAAVLANEAFDLTNDLNTYIKINNIQNRPVASGAYLFSFVAPMAAVGGVNTLILHKQIHPQFLTLNNSEMESLNRFDISLVGSDGSPVDLNLEWSMLLEINY